MKTMLMLMHLMLETMVAAETPDAPHHPADMVLRQLPEGNAEAESAQQQDDAVAAEENDIAEDDVAAEDVGAEDDPAADDPAADNVAADIAPVPVQPDVAADDPAVDIMSQQMLRPCQSNNQTCPPAFLPSCRYRSQTVLYALSR